MIYTAEVNIPEQFVQNILALQGVANQVKKSNKGGWQSELAGYKTYQWAQPVIDQVKAAANKIQVTYWFNINGKEHYNEWHDHDRGTRGELCAVLYLQTPEGCGNIEFKHKGTVTEFKPYPGLLIVFPDNMMHCVQPNISDQLRVSMAFNFWKM